MSESHGTQEHHGPNYSTYMVVFGALTAFTLISFVVNSWYPPGSEHAMRGASIIMGVAVVKAFLVGLIFMHLISDWGKVYFIIVPIFILGVMMVIVLLPDMVMAWHP
jgi:caa(3)-type oxidase subunit IV